MRDMEPHLTDRPVDVDPFPLPEEVADGAGHEPPETPPTPGMGLVWVVEAEGLGWHASWQGVDGSASFDDPDLEAVLAWARAQPAEGVMVKAQTDDEAGEGWHLLS